MYLATIVVYYKTYIETLYLLPFVNKTLVLYCAVFILNILLFCAFSNLIGSKVQKHVLFLYALFLWLKSTQKKVSKSTNLFFPLSMCQQIRFIGQKIILVWQHFQYNELFKILSRLFFSSSNVNNF